MVSLCSGISQVTSCTDSYLRYFSVRHLCSVSFKAVTIFLTGQSIFNSCYVIFMQVVNIPNGILYYVVKPKT